MMPRMAFLLGFCFNNNNEKTGTRTTLNPVMKPAFDEVVNNSPAVCVAYPTKSQKPINIPEKISFRLHSFNCLR